MKYCVASLLLCFSSLSAASTFNCHKASRDGATAVPFESTVIVDGREIQVSSANNSNIYFDNFDGQIAFSENRTITKVNNAGTLYFVVAEWGREIKKMKKSDKPNLQLGFGDCEMK